MGDSKNTIIGFLLIFAILIGYYFITAPSKEELQEQRRKQDSILAVQRERDSVALARQAERAPQQQQEQEITNLQEENLPQDRNLKTLHDQYGTFALAATGENKVYYIENDLMRIGMSAYGGKIIFVELKDYLTWDGQPLLLMDSDTNMFGFSFFANNRTINTNNFYFQPEWFGVDPPDNNTLRVSGDNEGRFALRLYTSSYSLFNKDQYI